MITDREVHIRDHPCHGSPIVKYWITFKSEEKVNVGFDHYILFPHWATFAFEGDEFWSIANFGNHEVREYFKRAEQGGGGNPAKPGASP